MIQEDYVNFEIAKLLKGKGFNGDVNCTHIYAYGKVFNKDDIRLDTIEEYIQAPTLQMAMKWLREVHNIHPNIVVEVYGPYPLYKIDRICDGDEEKWVDFKNDENISDLYNTYEEACEAAIRYCLENLV